MPITPSGTLTKNTACQPNPLVSAPPTSGPNANAAPIDAPYAASAFTRSSRPGNASASSDREVANSSAPPMPWMPRATSSTSMLPAIAQAIDAAVNSTRPTEKTRRRPMRSAIEPGGKHDRRERQRVRVDDPLQAAEARVQVVGDVR